MKIVYARFRLGVCRQAGGQGKTAYQKYRREKNCEADGPARWNQKSEHEGDYLLSLRKWASITAPP
jgi:hypothetical protein